MPNAKWTIENDDASIPFLAQMVKDGLKVDKNFKVLAYRKAKEEVNKKYSSEFTKENIMNHVKCLMGKYIDMRTVMIHKLRLLQWIQIILIGGHM